MPTKNIEGIITEITAEISDGNYTPLGFTADGYVSSNSYKVSLVNKRILTEKGIKRKKIAKPEEKEILAKIITTSGKTLPEYHYTMYELSPKDVSSLFSKFLAEYLNAGNITERVWIQKENNGRVKEYAFDWDEENKWYYSQKLCESLTKEEAIELAEKNKARPDARLYYENLYLSIPGVLYPNFGLMVTPWENDDEKIQKIARKGYENAKEIAGVYPLVIPFYDVEKDENYRKLAKYPDWLYISEERERIEEIEEKVIKDVEKEIEINNHTPIYTISETVAKVLLRCLK